MKSETDQMNRKLIIRTSLVLVLGLALGMALAIWSPTASKPVEPVAGKVVPGMLNMEKKPMVSPSEHPDQPK
jgi:hypothetical protein